MNNSRTCLLLLELERKGTKRWQCSRAEELGPQEASLVVAEAPGDC